MQYVNVYVSGLMKSLIPVPGAGAEKWYIVLQPPSCLGSEGWDNAD